MKKIIMLRPATMNDSTILLQWRNDSETRRASHNSKEIEQMEHIEWLFNLIDNPDKKLYIAWEKIEESPYWHDEDQSEYYISIVNPVGTVRIDYKMNKDYDELSWTVAPEARRRGIGKLIVKMVANQYKDKLIKAEIKMDNIASIKIAEYIGMRFNYKDTINNILHYFRKGIKDD